MTTCERPAVKNLVVTLFGYYPRVGGGKAASAWEHTVVGKGVFCPLKSRLGIGGQGAPL